MVSDKYINLTAENLAEQHLCCIIRTRTVHEGVEAKRRWLASRLAEGHVFRKLDVKGPVFIEYAPLERAWVPIEGEGYYYIYCLWVGNEFRGKGYAKALMEYCIEDAKAKGMSGVCMLGAKKQKAWLSDQSFAKRFGFRTVDTAGAEYELLALSFDDSEPPHFSETAKACNTESEGLTIYYDAQCPYIPQYLNSVRTLCADKGIHAEFAEVDSLEKAKSLPCVFNNWAVLCDGNLATVNLIDGKRAERLAAGK